MSGRDHKSIDDISVSWPFGCFWVGLNAQLKQDGFPEARYKAAREAWAASLDTAKRAIRDYSTSAMNG